MMTIQFEEQYQERLLAILSRRPLPYNHRGQGPYSPAEPLSDAQFL